MQVFSRLWFPGLVRSSGSKFRVREISLILLAGMLLWGSASDVLAKDHQNRVLRRSELPIKSTAVLTPPVELTAPTGLYPVNSTFQLFVTVDDITGDGIFAFQFNVIYDPAVIDPFGPNFGCSTAGTLAGAVGLSPTCNVLPDGTLRISVSGITPMNGSGTLMKLTFKTDVGTMAGNFSPLTLGSVFFFNAGGPVANNPHNGLVTLAAPTAATSTVRGRVTGPLGQSVSYAQITLTDSQGRTRSAISNPFGYFEFAEVPSGQSYVLSVQSRSYEFAPRVVEVGSDLVEMEITADPEK